MSDDDNPLVVWHYTDAAGFIGMVKTGHVWATAPLALNDVSEFQYGRDLIESVWDEIKANHPPTMDAHHRSVGGDSLHRIYAGGYVSDASELTYVVSASSLSDDLGQWRGYGRNGYAVGIATDVPLTRNGELVSEETAPDRSDWFPQRGWHRVVYDETAQHQIALDRLRSAIELPPDGILARVVQTQKLITTLASTMKHPSFASEQEIRYIYPGGTDDVEFRVGRFGVTPYVELSDPTNRLPIRGITCGPTGQQLSANDRVDHPKLKLANRLLLAHQYLNVPITMSGAPFRD